MAALTPAQQKRFWSVFAAACRNQGYESKEDREAYRKDILKTYGGVEHLGDLSRTEGYDKVMSRLSMAAGDYASAVKFVDSTNYRLIAVLEQKARAIAGPTWKEYVQGCMVRSGIGAGRTSLKDCSESEIRALIAIVDTKLRRDKAKAAG